MPQLLKFTALNLHLGLRFLFTFSMYSINKKKNICFKGEKSIFKPFIIQLWHDKSLLKIYFFMLEYLLLKICLWLNKISHGVFFQPGLSLLFPIKSQVWPYVDFSGRRDALLGDFSKKPTSFIKSNRVTATRGQLMASAWVLIWIPPI